MTGYGHRDENNKWEVERCLGTPGYGDSVIVSGDMVQLRHIATGRYLSVLPDVAGVTDLADNRVGCGLKLSHVIYDTCYCSPNLTRQIAYTF